MSYHLENDLGRLHIREERGRSDPQPQAPVTRQIPVIHTHSGRASPNQEYGKPNYSITVSRDKTTFNRVLDPSYNTSQQPAPQVYYNDGPPPYSTVDRPSPRSSASYKSAPSGGASSYNPSPQRYKLDSGAASSGDYDYSEGFYDNPKNFTSDGAHGSVQDTTRQSTQPQVYQERNEAQYTDGATSRLVYTAPTAPPVHGYAQSRPMAKDNTGPPSPGLPPPPQDLPSPTSNPNMVFRPLNAAANTGYRSESRPVTSGTAKLGDPRPYQLKPTLDSLHDNNTRKAVPVGKENEVDALTSLLVQNMEAAASPEFFGMCAKCGRAIMGESQGCAALDQLFHVNCFTCMLCNVSLKAQPFYAMEGRPYCEPCYVSTLEKCTICAKPITERILRATGRAFHPECFTCVVCGKSLDGINFTVDIANQMHCIEDYHRKYAPKCCVCLQPIMPGPNSEDTVRIVALDRSFHVKCYKCEDCGLVLSSDDDGRGCYPLDDHILCKTCNARRIQKMTSKITTEL